MTFQVERHGSRYPTKTQNKIIDDAVKKLKTAVVAKKIAGPEFEFLPEFEYPIGPDKEGQLTRIGLEESEIMFFFFIYLTTLIWCLGRTNLAEFSTHGINI